MMFGHDDNQHEHDKDNAPSPDGVLTPDNTAAPVEPPAAAPALPNDDDAASDFIMTDTPTVSEPATAHDDQSIASTPAVPSAPKSENTDELLQIKQEAMNALSPLIDHLDQSPKDKFRTTMMMIQASDNDKLIPVAYEAAKAIEDEKERAQALLDVVNEINYFTQSDLDKAA